MHLSERLRASTAAVHRSAEGAPLVASIMSGSIGLDLYCKVMRNLFDIYQALEQHLHSNASNPSIAGVQDRRLDRSDAIAADLHDLAGPSWHENIEVDGVTRQYLAQLAAVAAHDPAGLVAHAYVRYLGDLSGGQILQRALAPVVGAVAPQALRFYDFGSKQQVAAMKADFRAGLDTIEADQEALVKEALLAFEFHRRLFDALWQSQGKAVSNA